MAFVARRLLFYVVAAWVALTLNFFLPRAVPGNAVQDIMSKFPNLQPSAYKALEAMLGVGHPGSLSHQYWAYLVDVFHFNFGTDVIEYPAKVSTLLGETIPWTLTLVGTATVIAFVLGTALGILAGWRHGGWLDRVLPGLMFLQAIPYFFLALILVDLLAIKVHLFPIGQGYAGGLVPGWHWAFIGSAVYHSLLPAFTIVVTSVAGWMLQMRNVMITTIGEDYVLAAQAKGLSSRRVVFTYSWSNGGKSISFVIRQGVKWNNGTPMTPADVVFTYNLVNKNASINLAGLKISSVTTSGNTVTLSFPTAQYTNLQEIAGVPILPQSIWSTVGNPATFTDATPVGTGPYELKSFAPQGFTLTKNPSYWQASKVQVPNVYFPVYTSNTGALSALFSGDIDWTGNFIPGLQKDFVDTSPGDHHFWEAPGSTNAFIPNLNKWPTNQLAVRQAISLAVNRSVLASEGEAGLENPITNATGLTLPTFAAWDGPIASMTISTAADAAAAKQVLEHAGYTMGGNGFFEKDGKTVSITLVSPSAYTDYAEVGSIAAGELQAAGIDANFEGLTVSAWNQDVGDGDFQLAEHWSNGGLTPYNLYDNWLDSSLDTGSAATGDYERLNDPALDSDLAAVAGAATVAEQTADLVPIEKVRRDQPAGDPDHDGIGLVRVQLPALRRLADPAGPLRQRAALWHQQQRGIRH
jgi:ABC-type dipeptide/oligopeptide/nickel transport system permease component/ABC-type oligopeptide transport system substrate-binding subunit